MPRSERRYRTEPPSLKNGSTTRFVERQIAGVETGTWRYAAACGDVRISPISSCKRGRGSGGGAASLEQ